MIQDRDHYEAYYANKLWNLLPAVYRAQDTDQFNRFGPLRELVNRIGAQAAILRRSIDRLWQDQSIETCDDWVISYIGDLLATNLVTGLDAAGQRRDVARTIYYRRRKGTVAILEEIAADITGWDAKVVEFFRRLARTRHGLDPAIGLVQVPGDATDQLQQASGLVGPLTRTPMGGTARLTSVYGAGKVQSAFDEFYHLADFRLGQGQVGWHDIPRLGVFLWRLMSFATGPVTPVPVRGCPGWFACDPTGRDIPLFAKRAANTDPATSLWVSPAEAHLPTPISQALFDAETESLRASPPAVPTAASLYPNSVAVYLTPAPSTTLAALPLAELLVRPERGRVQALTSPPECVWLTYCYGFSDTTGAGPYDRRLVRSQPAQPTPIASPDSQHAFAIPGSGTFTLPDSLTYHDPHDVVMTGSLTIMAANKERPLLRFKPETGWREWRITGQSGANLALDGLFVSGTDIVLCGNFNCVTITCCSLDPGSSSNGAAFLPEELVSSPWSEEMFATAADGQALTPCRLWIEGSIATLNIQRSVTGPIRTRGGGEVGQLCLTDSVVQGIRTTGWGPFTVEDVKDPRRLERILRPSSVPGAPEKEPVSDYLRSFPAIQEWLETNPASPPDTFPPLGTEDSLQALVTALNEVLAPLSLYRHKVFSQVPLSPTTRELRRAALQSTEVIPAFNRSLLEDAFPLELADAALALDNGNVSLSRCTVLGRVGVHHLTASECILGDFSVVDDTQHGCVRFTCSTTGSVLPRQYESVQIPPRTDLFTATDFGQPGYGQLLPTVDARIQSSTTAAGSTPSILSGAENGSEMGAFCLSQNSLKEQALLIKYQEYMPFGMTPVLIHVT